MQQKAWSRPAALDYLRSVGIDIVLLEKHDLTDDEIKALERGIIKLLSKEEMNN